MRFVELICFSLILAVFSSLCSSFIFQLGRLDHQLEKIKAERDSLVFISQSFSNAGKGKGFASLDEWKRVCSAMWKLVKLWRRRRRINSWKLVWSVWKWRSIC